MTTRWARFARGWLAAVFSTLVAAASHTLAGGESPSVVSLAIALAFAGITCIALTGKTLSLPRLTAAVLVSQVAFHTLFSTISSPATVVQTAGTGAHDHGATVELLAGSATGTHHSDGWMWLGHAAAAIVTIVTLRYGEGAFWRVRGIAALFVRTALAQAPDVPLLPRIIRTPRTLGHLFVPRICAILRASLGLRGPPVRSFA
ncbi:hypothetical protein [Conyzicola sp.]|uniref:hypothetical protein n=1 Tax=Conyzicola sp. TaxID=1969404 RepID=UPI00398A0C5B